ncbi:DMT family transporter [Desulfobulbus oligotrophicus]|uniref:DMT family transporter n=1 Tax=Desulfobulbus oligotrophicus TaxID=1909699 RepID=A0A7T5VBR1_9BACT|nr:DMT family transporter [Desulfobulbus oligotrophicus]QQG64965.1 DMT family transporter [Desulfobulbus oligotrophicus]
MQEEKQHTFGADFLLLLVALIWGFGFVAQRAGMEHLGPYTFNGIRFLFGSFCLLPLVLRQQPRQHDHTKNQISLTKAGLIAGVMLFAAATFQQVGLQYTTAGKAGFITGLYVVLVPLIGLLWGQKTTAGTWLGAAAAAVGLYLLSVNEDFSIEPGDLLELFGAVFWAGHVLVLAYLSPRTNPVRLAMVQCVVCGVLSLAVSLVTESFSLAALSDAAIPLIYGSVFSVAAGYTLQVVVQRKAHPSHAAILLSLESPFAALGGWLLLGEILSGRAMVGCALMLTGMLASQLWTRTR